MTKKEQAALNRVAKKLSALRVTLRKDERDWLDRVILGQSEVAAHAATAPSKAMKVSKVAAAEVAAHAATAPSKAMKVSKVAAAEVAAHAATIPQRIGRVARSQGENQAVLELGTDGVYRIADRIS